MRPPGETRGPGGAATLAQLFWARAEGEGAGVAQRVKRGEAWTEVSWASLAEEVRELALGLLALSRERGSAIGILSQTRAEWVRADFAIFSAGGVTIPIYPTYPPDEVAYIVNDAGVQTLFVEDERQLDKVLARAGDMPTLDSVVLMQGAVPVSAPAADGRRPALHDWAALRALGRSRRAELEDALATRVPAGSAEDVATIVYTSGTTGHPKGVVQTHGNHLAALRAAEEASAGEIRPGDTHLLFLPLAHSFGRLEAFIGVHRGLVTAFAEGLDKLGENLREVRPDFICSVPRVFEKVYARILSGVETAPPAKRRLFRWAVGVGRRISAARRAGRRVPPGLRLQGRVADRLVLRKVHGAFGGRLRLCFSGGAPLSPEIAEFFHAVGVLVLEGYGLTETCPILTVNRVGRFKFGTVGLPYPGVELRLAEDGEILARAPNVARGYHNRPAETAEAFAEDGWFRTGDIGEIDAEGFLRITDRKKDLIKTAGGSYVAPQHIENLLKGDPFVSQALVHGDRRPYPVALVTVSADEVRKLAREGALAGADPGEPTRSPAVIERVRQTVEAVNAQLPSYAQIKRFAVLPTDFTLEGGELTPTLKLKRKQIREKYTDVLESLYS